MNWRDIFVANLREREADAYARRMARDRRGERSADEEGERTTAAAAAAAAAADWLEAIAALALFYGECGVDDLLRLREELLEQTETPEDGLALLQLDDEVMAALAEVLAVEQIGNSANDDHGVS